MSNIRIAELDFDQIKTNLKNYLQDQTEFSDYDFEGSGLSVLIDVLAYNTHYNAYLANMLANEMFLDSAVKRSSAVSLAKHLGYIPMSARGAKADLDIEVTSPTGSPSTLTIPKYTSFISSTGGTSYTFVNLSEVITTPVDGVYTFSNVEVTEGTPYSYSYTVVTPGPGEKYVIPSTNIDTSSLEVTVQNSSVDLTTSTYKLATDITGVGSTSEIFFLQENSQEKYEIFFGDGIIGKQLEAGNIITIRYVITNGADANTSAQSSQSFTCSETIGGSSNISITTVNNSRGGAAKETITSIKFNAPLINAAKNRAVTSNDYRSLIAANYPEVESVSVWGGEDNVPPMYGKVVVSLKPYEGFVISTSTKDSIKNTLLASRKVTSVQVEFVDPVYTYVGMDINIKYNPSVTNLNSSQIESQVRAQITTFFNNELSKFDRDFYLTKLNTVLLGIDSSIVSIIPEVRLQKRLVPVLSVTNNYSGDYALDIQNKIHPSRVYTSFFYTMVSGNSTLVYVKDIPNDVFTNYEGTGTLKLYNAITDQLINDNYGTVNYGTGVLEIPALYVTGFPAGYYDIKLTCELQEASYDVQADRSQVLLLDSSTLNVPAGVKNGVDISILPIVE